VALITDAASRARRAASMSAMSGLRLRWRPDRLLRDGDMITLDAENGILAVALSAGELAARAKDWKARELRIWVWVSVEIRPAGRAGARWRRHASGGAAERRAMRTYDVVPELAD